MNPEFDIYAIPNTDPLYRTVIIPNVILSRLPNTTQALAKLLKACDFPFAPCVKTKHVSSTGCESYIVVVVQLPEDDEGLWGQFDDHSFFLHNMEILAQRSSFMGMATVQGFAKIYGIKVGEIYGVCVKQKYRSKGVGSMLIRSIIDRLGRVYEQLWLGIDLRNKMFPLVAKLYIRFGFADPSVVTVTPSGMEIGNPVVGLTRIHNRMDDVNKNAELKQTLKYFYEYDDKNHTCEVPFIIGISVLSSLYDYLDRDREYASELSVVGYRGSNAVIGYNKDKEIKGNEPPNFVVTTPTHSKLFFHTHPRVCYRHLGCHLGWPSGGDMMVTLHTYILYKTYMNFVATAEGLYAITLTPQFMRMVHHLDIDSKCVAGLMQITKEKFDHLESYRHPTVIAKEVTDFKFTPEETREYIKLYLREVQNYTFNTLLERVTSVYGKDAADIVLGCSPYLKSRTINGEVIDFPLFEVSYREWSATLTELGQGFTGRFFSVKGDTQDVCTKFNNVIL